MKKQPIYDGLVSPADNLSAVIAFLCQLGGVPEGDGSTGYEVNGAAIDYFSYLDKETGTEKFGVDIKNQKTGVTLFHCMRYRGKPQDMKEVMESEFFRYQTGPDVNGNLMVMCFQEQTMELEVERIIDYCASVLRPEAGTIAA